VATADEEGIVATDVRQAHETARVAREYFEALARGEADAPVRFYAPEGRGEIHGVIGPAAPEESAAFFQTVFGAFPDWRFDVLELLAEGDRAAVRWRARGTFAGPGSFMGFEPTGARVDVEGADVVQVTDGRIVRVDAYMNGAELARQLGALPPQGSVAEERMAKAFNVRTRMRRRLLGGDPEPIADGVWIVRGGFPPPKSFSVYLVRDGDGVLVYDAGVRTMADQVAAAGARLGGITRVILSHGHPDHRGVAGALGVPVLCHPDARADAEGDGGRHYFRLDQLRPYARPVFPRLLDAWDGGPVQIDRTVAAGEVVAGFEVIALPGHAPGLIGLWRASDRLALVSDAFYTLDPQTGRYGPARVPPDVFNFDTDQARASLRKLADLEPAAAWPGHAEPLTGDVAGTLRAIADGA
jgi:glyoxylase-like metal-dependent hydrolase (beta-lactamase superfamily II)/predicted ester cyclase